MPENFKVGWGGFAGAFLERMAAPEPRPRHARPGTCSACGLKGPLTDSGECHQCADPDAKRWAADHDFPLTAPADGPKSHDLYPSGRGDRPA